MEFPTFTKHIGTSKIKIKMKNSHFKSLLAPRSSKSEKSCYHLIHPMFDALLKFDISKNKICVRLEYGFELFGKWNTIANIKRNKIQQKIEIENWFRKEEFSLFTFEFMSMAFKLNTLHQPRKIFLMKMKSEKTWIVVEALWMINVSWKSESTEKKNEEPNSLNSTTILSFQNSQREHCTRKCIYISITRCSNFHSNKPTGFSCGFSQHDLSLLLKMGWFIRNMQKSIPFYSFHFDEIKSFSIPIYVFALRTSIEIIKFETANKFEWKTNLKQTLKAISINKWFHAQNNYIWISSNYDLEVNWLQSKHQLQPKIGSRGSL